MRTKLFIGFSIFILLCKTPLCAILLEPADNKPNTYQARHLFLESSVLSAPKIGPAEDKFISSIEVPISETIQQSIKPVAIQTRITSLTLNAYYERVTTESVNQICSKYKSIPGGITLEGSGINLGFIKVARYDPTTNAFIINEKIEYKNPLSRHEAKRIIVALQQNDLLGVSLGETDLIYGALQQGELPVIHMKLADHFLGSIVFAQPRWIRLHSFPNGYKPQSHTSSGGLYAVYFNFCNYKFVLDNDHMSLQQADFVARLVPLTNIKTGDGGYLPDLDKIGKGLLPLEYEKNIQHIVKNIAHYEAETRLNKTHRYGEIAAFIRTLRDSGVSLEALSSEM